MVCPNCQSEAIVEIQGQHFCTNCGRLIEQITTTKKKAKPGRPKAPKLDVPRRPAVDSSSDEAPAQTPGRRLADIVAAPSASPSANTVAAETKTKPTRPAEPYRPLALRRIVSAAWSEPWQPGPLRLAVLVSLVAGATAGAAAWRLIQPYSTRQLVFGVIGLLVVGVTLGLISSLAAAERVAAGIRRYDHRPVVRRWLLGLGLGSTFQRLVITKLAALIVAVTVGLVLGLVRYGTPYGSAEVAVAVLFAAFLGLCYILVATWTVTSLALAQVTLADVSPWRAIAEATRTVSRYSELLGIRLLAAIWTILTGLGLAASFTVAAAVFPAWRTGLVIGGAGVTTAVVWWAALFAGIGFRHAAYHTATTVLHPADSAARLTGRRPAEPKRLQRLAFGGFCAVLGAATIGIILVGKLY